MGSRIFRSGIYHTTRHTGVRPKKNSAICEHNHRRRREALAVSGTYHRNASFSTQFYAKYPYHIIRPLTGGISLQHFLFSGTAQEKTKTPTRTMKEACCVSVLVEWNNEVFTYRN